MAIVASLPRATRRHALAHSAALLAAPLAAACAPRQPESGPAQPAAPASISVWFNPWTPALPAWDQTVAEFQAKQPNVKVSIEPLAGGSSEQEQKILASIAAGVWPDVTYVHPSFNATFVIKEIIVALEPFLAKGKGTFDLKDFYPGAIDYFRWDGKLWALPNYSGPGVYYYNTALLRQRGLEDPWDLFQKGQWTLQKMDDLVQKLTTGQGDTKVFGRNAVPTSIQMVSPWIQGFGGDVWNAQVTETLLHQDGSVKAWEYAATQLTNGWAPGAQDTRGVAGGAQGLFNGGRIAFYWGIRSEVPAFKEVPFAVVPQHKMPNGKEFNRDGPNGLSITHGSKQQDAAWQFMMFELTRGVELKMGTGFTAPTTHTHAKSPLWLNQLIGGENPRAYDAAAEMVKAIPLPPRLNDINTLVGDAYQKVVGGQASAKAALAEIKPQVDAILASRGK